MTERLETRTATVWVDEQGICHLDYREGVTETLEDSRAVLEAMKAIGGGRRMPTLIDIRKVASVSRESRHFYGSEAMRDVVAAGALLVGSGVSRAIGNFFLGVVRPATRAKLFTSEAEALDWLRSAAP